MMYGFFLTFINYWIGKGLVVTWIWSPIIISHPHFLSLASLLSLVSTVSTEQVYFGLTLDKSTYFFYFKSDVQIRTYCIKIKIKFKI